jgi:hypothetical protein
MSPHTQSNPWSPKQQCLIQWLAKPVVDRDPKNLDELAIKLNRRPATLERWQRLPGFDLAVDQAIRHLLLDRIPEFYKVIADKAVSGDFRFLKLALELAGHYPPRRVVPPPDVVKPFTIDEYRDALAQVAAWEKERFENLAQAGGDTDSIETEAGEAIF